MKTRGGGGGESLEKLRLRFDETNIITWLATRWFHIWIAWAGSLEGDEKQSLSSQVFIKDFRSLIHFLPPPLSKPGWCQTYQLWIATVCSFRNCPPHISKHWIWSNMIYNKYNLCELPPYALLETALPPPHISKHCIYHWIWSNMIFLKSAKNDLWLLRTYTWYASLLWQMGHIYGQGYRKGSPHISWSVVHFPAI